MRSLQLFSEIVMIAVPVFGAFQIPNAPNSTWTRAGNGVQASNILAKLYVSSYDGNVTTFQLGASGKAIALSSVSRNTQCGAQPTWLNFDKKNRVLYCVNEQFNPDAGNASFAKYSIDASGKLQLSKIVNTTVGGPVHTAFLPQQGFHVLAHYSPGALSALDQDLNFVSSINTTVDTPAPGAPENQQGSHVHEVIVDPSGQYVFGPDLGQDKVWMTNYSGKNQSDKVYYFEVPKGTGPRHAVFAPLPNQQTTNKVMFYVTGEISNTIEGYGVSYTNGTLDVSGHVSQVSATQAPVKAGYSTAELALSPDQKFIIVSNRNNSLSSVNECSATLTDCKSTPADTIVTFKPTANGTLEHVQTWSAGGMLPRSFSLNSKGDMIAVGLLSRFVIMERDVKTGKIGQIIADAVFDKDTAVTNIVWDEAVGNATATNATVKAFFGGQSNVY